MTLITLSMLNIEEDSALSYLQQKTEYRIQETESLWKRFCI